MYGALGDVVNVVAGFTVVLPCEESKIVTDYPGWTFDTKSLTDRHKFRENNLELSGKQGRLLWAINKRDLIITDVRHTDEGEYQCFGNGVRGRELNLIVEGKLVLTPKTNCLHV